MNVSIQSTAMLASRVTDPVEAAVLSWRVSVATSVMGAELVVAIVPLPERRTKLFQFPSMAPCRVIFPLAALVLIVKSLLAVSPGEMKVIEDSMRTSAPAVVVVMKSRSVGVRSRPAGVAS